MLKIFYFFVLFFSLFTINIAFAQVEFVRSTLVTGAYVKAFKSGDYLYAVNRWGLQIFDTTVADTLLMSGGLPTPDEAWGIFVKGDYAYVADRLAGMIIVDVSNPQNPTFVGQYDTDGATNDIVVDDGVAYLADGLGGMTVVDVSSPSEPSLMAKFSLPDDGSGSRAMGIALYNDYVYLAAQITGLIAIDVSNPRNPVQAGILDTDGAAHSVVVKGSFVYIADRQNGLVIANIGNPAMPAFVSNYLSNQCGPSGGLTWGVAVNDNYAYITDNCSMFIGDPPNSMIILDISNPFNPTFAGGYASNAEAVGVAVDDSNVYVSLFTSGIHKVNITNSSSPAFSGKYEATGYVKDLLFVDEQLYVAHENGGMVIMDAGDLSNPVFISRYKLGGIRSMAWNNNIAYLGSNFNRIYSIDVNDPFNPLLLQEYIIPVDISFTPDYIESLDADSDYLYAGYTNPTSGAGGLITMDVSSNPGFPDFVSNYPLNSAVFKVVVSENKAFIGTSSDGVIILDISNPANPTLFNQIPVGDNIVRDLFVTDNSLYIASDKGGVVVYEISDLNNPQFVNLYGVNGLSYGVMAKNDNLYLANSFGQEAFTVLDITNPNDILSRANFDTPGFAEGITGKDNYIYITDGYDIAIYKDGTVTSVNDDLQKKLNRFSLGQNYPNPFDSSTTIDYELKMSGKIEIKIYSASGILIKPLLDQYKTPGKYSVTWNGKSNEGRRVAPGVYFYQIKFRDEIYSKKMLILE